MPRVHVRAFEGRPLLDIASYARKGPGRPNPLSPDVIAHIERTVRRAPEVMVKVLAHDSHKLGSIARHFDYIGRKGALEMETDTGEQLVGQGLGREILEDWDLDLDEHRKSDSLSASNRRAAPKPVHKLMFSMPPGTSPSAVLAATRNFLREEFGLTHRYVFVLHTDEPHPHVHAVVKAVSEQGIRLSIRKAKLRAWRADFAQKLRDQGVSANATERAARGVSQVRMPDGRFRANQRGASRRFDSKSSASSGTPKEAALHEHTREQVARGWAHLAVHFAASGHRDLAVRVRAFADSFAREHNARKATKCSNLNASR